MKKIKVKASLQMINMMLLAIVLGILSGLGTLLFHHFVALAHNVAFLGHFNFMYNENIHTPASRWGICVIFLPMFGSVIVLWLRNIF